MIKAETALPHNHILVAGIHRSGSTYVGKVLSKATELHFLYKPFNRNYGLKGVNHWYPYCRASSPNQYAEVAHSLFIRRFEFKTNIASDTGLKKVVKQIVGGKAHLKIFFYKRFLYRYKSLLIKDPFASFMCSYLHQRRGVKVVLLVRHPAAFYQSLKRMNWSFDFQNFLDQEALMQDHLESFRADFEKPDKTPVETACILWNAIYTTLRNQYQECGEQWLLVRHEDICLDPIPRFKAIFDYCDLDFTQKVVDFIHSTTEAENVAAKDNQIHDLKRNSKELTYSWRDSLTSEEVAEIRDLTFPLASAWYSEKEF